MEENLPGTKVTVTWTEITSKGAPSYKKPTRKKGRSVSLAGPTNHMYFLRELAVKIKLRGYRGMK